MQKYLMEHRSCKKAILKTYNTMTYLVQVFASQRSGLERSPRKRKVESSNPSRVRPKSLKQVVIPSFSNARH